MSNTNYPRQLQQLGLNIARSILDGYGMDYGAESTVGKGSTFWFEMEEAPAEKQ